MNLPAEVFHKTVYWESGANNPKGYKNFTNKITNNEEY